jgi:hypothetical protein
MSQMWANGRSHSAQVRDGQSGLAQLERNDRISSDNTISLSLAPILGGGVLAFQRPDKQLSVLHAELVLCGGCQEQCRNFWGDFKLTAGDYACHPWAANAARIGYKRMLSADELPRLKSVPPPTILIGDSGTCVIDVGPIRGSSAAQPQNWSKYSSGWNRKFFQ